MNSRDRQKSLDPLEITLRESLLARVENQTPALDLRRRLLHGAARQQRRFAWGRSMAWPTLFRKKRPAHEDYWASYRPMYAESLFGPALRWFSFNQLMR